MSLSDITSRLNGSCRPAGKNQWKAKCPAHEDGVASLSIGRGDDGRALLTCHAGCKTDDVLAAMGLTVTDLFDGQDTAAKETLPEAKWPTKATYTYFDAEGVEVYRVLRKVSPDSGKKTFRQEAKRKDGSWVPNMDTVTRVLYRLPELKEADRDETVYVVEGEKDVDNMLQLGAVATTNVGGAGKWLPSYSEHLRGRNVVVLPDNDEPGEKHAGLVATALDGIARSVKVVRLPGLPAKGDVSDWINAGGTLETLTRLVAASGPARQGFVSSPGRMQGERAERVEAGRQSLTFGVRFLDEALGGIGSRDLILLGAKTGTGKTALATIAALANCKAGKRVHYFALEAEEREIERRMKFQIIAREYYANGGHVLLRYPDWYLGRLDHVVGGYEDFADAEIARTVKGLKTFYRHDSFTSDDFCRHLESIKDETDLVILDHLHYVDSADENENRGYKRTVKQIRDSALRAGKPVMVVAHVRKGDRRYEALLPNIEDFHGSSDIPKIATKAIMLAPDYETKTGKSSLWMTYMQIAKCRMDSSLTRYVARLIFDTRQDCYLQDYTLGRLGEGGKVFNALVPDECPAWKDW